MLRFDPANGNRKRFTPHHINKAGQTLAKKGDKPWPLYKEEEAIAEGAGKWILWVEGEKCADASRWLQFVTVTPSGSASTGETEAAILRLQKAGIAGIALIRDMDSTGEKKAAYIAKICHRWGIPVIDLADYQDIPDNQDIADLVRAEMENREELIEKLNRAYGPALGETRQQIDNKSDNHNGKKPPKKEASEYAKELLDEWHERLAWDIQAGEWKWYGVEKPGLWSRCDVVEVHAVIQACLNRQGIHYGAGLVSSIERLMRAMFKVGTLDSGSRKKARGGRKKARGGGPSA